MANKITNDFTIFIEGHDGHQGNVLAGAYVTRITKLLTVLAKLERVFLDAGQKKTEFEIVGAEKYNPTTITLKPVAKVAGYNPRIAMSWGLEQIELVGKGTPTDQRVKSAVVRDLVDLSKEDTSKAFKAFWINGHTAPIQFDENYNINARLLAAKLANEEAPTSWFSGVSMGEVVGRLEKIDNLDADHEFVIVPPIGADAIRCKFPQSMEDEIGSFMFQMVRVKGTIRYSDISPHPESIVVDEHGIDLIQQATRTKTLREMRGIFAGDNKPQVEWGTLFSV